MNKQYIGARYVPKFFTGENGSTEWVSGISYEALTIVTHLGNSFTSKKPVPVGIDILNTDYWVSTGNYNSQIEEYRQQVEQVKTDLTAETTARKTADTQLQTNINNETTARQNADTQLQTNINNETTARQNADTELLEKINLIKYPFIVIGKNGNFSNIQDAINKVKSESKKEIYLYILPGEYETIADFTYFEYVCIVGADRLNTVLYNSEGVYKSPVLNMGRNFTIYNLTVKTNANSSFTPSWSTSDVMNTYPNYCIHADYTEGDLSVTTKASIIDCNLESATNSAIGAGTQSNNTLEIINCIIKRVSTGSYSHHTTNLDGGALLVHNSNTSGAVNQFLLVKDCLIECTEHVSAVFNLSIATSDSTMKEQFINNNFIVDSVEPHNLLDFSKGNSTLLSSSNNNNRNVNNISNNNCLISLNKSIGLTKGSATDININWADYNYIFIGFRMSANYDYGGGITLPIPVLISNINDSFQPSINIPINGSDAFNSIVFKNLNTITITSSSDTYNSVSIYCLS